MTTGTEAAVQRQLVRELRAEGHAVREFVRCAAGIVDVLTETTIYEVKGARSLRSMRVAAGQVATYRGAMGEHMKACVVLPAGDPGEFAVCRSWLMTSNIELREVQPLDRGLSAGHLMPVPGGTLDIHRVATLRASTHPWPLSWHKVGIALGVTGEAARRFYERWKHLIDAPPE